MTYEALLRQGQKTLTEAGLEEAALDAWLLMEYVFSMTKSQYYMHSRDEAEEEYCERYRALLEKRCRRIPLQHLTGQAWFMGREYYVDHRVLVPRQDTELLVEEAEQYLKPGMCVLDMCTGSGCILFSLVLDQEVQGIGADLSEDALKVAEINRKKLGIRDEQAVLLQSDLFEKVEGRFDMIISNPPYIPTEEIRKLAPEVREYDPWMALDGLEDGLCFYRKITEMAEKYLNPEGFLLYEIGWDQGEAVAKLLINAGFKDVYVKKDYAGLDRIVCGRLK